MRATLIFRDQQHAWQPHTLAGSVLLATVRMLGQPIAKGTRIDLPLAGTLLAALRLGEVTELRVAFPDPDDMHEDEAAERLGLAVGGGGVDLTPPRQSKLDLAAKWDGVLHVRVPALLSINAIDPLEVFTLLHGQCVLAGQVVASVKVATHVVAGESLRHGIRLAREEGPVIEVRPYQPHVVPAIVCEPLEPAGRQRFIAGASAKLGAMGSQFAGVIDAAGATPAEAVRIAHAALAQVGDARVVLVAGVSAGDPVAPFCQALEQVGGSFIRRGVPAHPGSMLWLGRLGTTTLLGLPSCGMFSLATAADLVLPRLLTGEHLDGRALAELAHGGVLSRDMRFRMPGYARALEAPGDER